ncbi:MAG: arginine--tRNA ligase [Candidatus Woesebacteria bacterium]|nr:arginine--tRNA ligase [Candidatus Woesebacteria bacterium]
MKAERNNMTDNNPLYIIQKTENQLIKAIESQLVNKNQTPNIIEAPLSTGFDYGINLTSLASQEGLSPHDLALQIANTIDGAEAVGSFLNFKLNMSEFGHSVVDQILDMKSDYGKENEGNGQRVVIDMSSPNIAKRMSYGHLRSTIIGDALANLHRSAGYEVIRDNHIGDWGTQFGKLIVAIKNWGNEQELLTSDDPIGVLQDLYVKFHSEEETEKGVLREEAKQKIALHSVESITGLKETIETISQEIMTRKKIPKIELDMTKITEDALDRVIVTSLEKEGRNWFLKLEKGNKEARRLWKLCIDLSLKEFNQIYEVLGVNFEESFGESFYEGMLTDVINKVSSSKAGHISNGALVIDMEDKGLGVAIVQKSDGASVYMTRDLACAIYREEEMKADKAIYVVGDDQKQYFEQLFEALTRLDYKIGKNSVHVYFGMVSLPEGKMSTRKGRVILLKDVLNEGFKKAKDVIEKKSPELNKNEALKNEIVRQVAVGSLKWNDLCQDPRKSIIFNWDKALNFDGNSAPYVQYTAVRANSIIETSEIDIISLLKNNVNSKKDYQEASEKALIRQLANFPSAIKDGLDNNSPAKIASYVFELAKRFNSFYGKNRVLGIDDENIASSRLKLVAATSQTIKNSLAILGIEVPLKM